MNNIDRDYNNVNKWNRKYYVDKEILINISRIKIIQWMNYYVLWIKNNKILKNYYNKYQLNIIVYIN